MHLTTHHFSALAQVIESSSKRTYVSTLAVKLTYISHMVAERGTRPPLQERISERIRERIVDTYVSQMVEQLLEVPKIIRQDRILQRTMKQIVDCTEAKRADLAKAEKSLAASMASQAASKSSYTQVASDHETSGRAFADELKALAEATQVLQSGTSGADGQPYSLLQESSSAALRTSTDLKGFELVILVRRLAEQEHYARSAGIVRFCNHEIWCRR